MKLTKYKNKCYK